MQCGFVQFTGAILGCMLCDFFLLRLRTIPLAQLYEPSGPFRYTYGFNLIGMGSMLLAVGPCLPGLLAKLSAEDSVAVLEGWLGGNHDAALLFSGLYDVAWFVSVAVAALSYLALSWLRPSYQLLQGTPISCSEADAISVAKDRSINHPD